MRDYAELVKALREHAKTSGCDCDSCIYYDAENRGYKTCSEEMAKYAADAIEELLRIGAKMHNWIFLHTTDEQAAYDEIGLTDEQNAMFGYSGKMILKPAPPKGVE